MRKRLIFILLFLLPFIGRAQEPESLEYELRYKLGAMKTKVANATMTLEPSEWQEQPAYLSVVKIRVAPVFRLFMRAEYMAGLYLSNPGMESVYNFSQTGKDYTYCYYGKGERGIHFERHPKGRKQGEHFFFDNDGRTFELLSLLWYIRRFDFDRTETLDLKAFFTGTIMDCQVRRTGQDSEKYPGHTADCIQVDLLGRGLMENGSGNQVLVWRDTEGTRPILGLEISLGKGTMFCNITNL